MDSGQFSKEMTGIIIETTTYCNRKCYYCPNHTIGRKNKLMRRGTFYKIIDDLKKHNFHGNIEPTGYGEPLTDPRLEEFIAYMRKNLADSNIGIATNGDFLTIEKFLILKYVGVNYFMISYDITNPPGAAIKTINIIKKKNPDLLPVIGVKNVNKLIKNRQFHNRCGLVDLEIIKYERCPYSPIKQMNIDVDGNILFCCHDYLGRHIFGNVDDGNLYGIWNSKKYIKFRNLINNGKLPYKMCKICTGREENPMRYSSSVRRGRLIDNK